MYTQLQLHRNSTVIKKKSFTQHAYCVYKDVFPPSVKIYTFTFYCQNILFMADSKIYEMLRGLSDQAGAQPFSQCTVVYWIVFLVSSLYFGRETFFYNLIMVIMIFALLWAFHFATRWKWIDDLSGCYYADQKTLDECTLAREQMALRFPKPAEHALPDAQKYANKQYGFVPAQKKVREEHDQGLIYSHDPASSAKAGGAGPSKIQDDLMNAMLNDNGWPANEASAAKKRGARGARSRSPGPKAPVPMCTDCGVKRIQGAKAQESGICATCTKKKK